MPDAMAERVLDKVFGAVPEKKGRTLSDEEQVVNYLRLNTSGWQKVVQKLGPAGARTYYNDMETKRKKVGL